jgi:hypothetical protein
VKSQTLPKHSIDRDTELAELRAEVARGLSADSPDEAALTALLAQLDEMLDAARHALACALHEITEPRLVDAADAALRAGCSCLAECCDSVEPKAGHLRSRSGQ